MDSPSLAAPPWTAFNVGPAPRAVRYIKLGDGGEWEQACLETGTLRMGFGAGHPERFALCQARQWAALTASYQAQGLDKGTVTRFTNEVRLFFEDAGEILWITFVGESLYWGHVDGDAVHRLHPDGDSVVRPLRGGWCRTDRQGQVLTKDRLSGALCKLAAYRGTSCRVDVADYVVRRINGQRLSVVDRATAVVEDLRVATVALVRLLTPADFELLVDLVFSSSGWRRVGTVGRTQKTLDLDLVLPSTGERAFVQVKSHTTAVELAAYVARLDELRGTHARMFFVYHSGAAATADPRVTVIGPDRLATLVMDAGLVNWLIQKVS